MATDLDKVISEFNAWQAGTNGRVRLPIHIKQQVLGLCQRYSLEELENCLGLKKARIRQWQRRARIATKSALTNPIDFVTLTPSKQTKSEDHTRTLTLTIELSTGVKLLFSGQNIADLVELTSHLAKRLIA